MINAFLPLLERGPTKKVMMISSFAADINFIVNSGYPTSASYSAYESAVNIVNAKYAAEFREKAFVFSSIITGTYGDEAPPEHTERVSRAGFGCFRSQKSLENRITVRE
jgi:hypothetical protein